MPHWGQVGEGETLIEVIVPQDGEMQVELRGDLAGILDVAANARSPSVTDGLLAQFEMVAGARNHLYRTFLVWFRRPIFG